MMTLARGAPCVRALRRRSRISFHSIRAATKKREAERRKTQSIHCPRSTEERCHSSVPGRGSGRDRSPLAFRRSTAALVIATERSDSAQAALHAIERMHRYPHRQSRLSQTPGAPVVMPEGSMPGPPGSGVTSPARGNRTRSIQRLSPVDVPEVSELFGGVT
jgi:hypothetical protein